VNAEGRNGNSADGGALQPRMGIAADE
jgi:hypothetical protein